jgi:hypothetical protein
MEIDKDKCPHPISRCSNVAWHHFNKDTMIPIVICHSCYSILDMEDSITLFTKNKDGEYIKC